jgi:hypothetical protein
MSIKIEIFFVFPDKIPTIFDNRIVKLELNDFYIIGPIIDLYFK